MALLVISYSRIDQTLVRDIVSLLKAAFRDVERAVFWDGELEPGEPWFEQLKLSIDAAPQLFVFWCEHSAASRQVKREYKYALKHKKRVVPVLLDDTPLVRQLRPIHGIDLRAVISHSTTGADTEVAKKGVGLRATLWPAVLIALGSLFSTNVIFIVVAALAVAFILLLFFLNSRNPGDGLQEYRRLHRDYGLPEDNWQNTYECQRDREEHERVQYVKRYMARRDSIVRQFAKYLAADGTSELSPGR